VNYAGPGNDGGDLFDMALGLPQADEPGNWPSPSQGALVQRFYGLTVRQGLTEAQIHVLLTWRDFATAVVEREMPELYGKQARVVAGFVAVFISQDDDLAAAVTRMMDRRFDRGADPDDLPEAVGRLHRYAEIASFLHDVVADMCDAGASI
jgi:hypothetical protein